MILLIYTGVFLCMCICIYSFIHLHVYIIYIYMRLKMYIHQILLHLLDCLASARNPKRRNERRKKRWRNPLRSILGQRKTTSPGFLANDMTGILGKMPPESFQGNLEVGEIRNSSRHPDRSMTSILFRSKIGRIVFSDQNCPPSFLGVSGLRWNKTKKPIELDQSDDVAVTTFYPPWSSHFAPENVRPVGPQSPKEMSSSNHWSSTCCFAKHPRTTYDAQMCGKCSLIRSIPHGNPKNPWKKHEKSYPPWN